jgi:hypothetical protein
MGAVDTVIEHAKALFQLAIWPDLNLHWAFRHPAPSISAPPGLTTGATICRRLSLSPESDWQNSVDYH